MHASLPALALSIAACALSAVTPASARPHAARPAISVQTLRDVDKTLASDAFEGRKPTTPAEAKTVAYIIQRFKAAGLKPGNHGQWTQAVPMVEITARNVTPLSFTGGKAPVSLAYGPEMVVATYRVTPKIAIKDSPVVFVGYGIHAPERGWDDYAGVDVKGKPSSSLSTIPIGKSRPATACSKARR